MASAEECRREIRSLGTVPSFTPRELQTLRALSQGWIDREIARMLGLRERTINHYVQSILGKLSANNRTHAVIQALRMGLIETE